ncbi:MAG: hypothetical protein ACD_34C00032G0002 [uncultured bacterium]|nr:MAG: hypothetical protein ACD_34C00032G0002 [uncultured bacterium]
MTTITETTTIKNTNGMAGKCSILLVTFTAANSVVMVPKLAINKAKKMSSEILTPNRSRIRSASPRRVTRVKRMPISCVTANKNVMINNMNSTG